MMKVVKQEGAAEVVAASSEAMAAKWAAGEIVEIRRFRRRKPLRWTTPARSTAQLLRPLQWMARDHQTSASSLRSSCDAIRHAGVRLAAGSSGKRNDAERDS